MTILYVYAHPQLASFNATLKGVGLEALKEHHQSLVVSDLYDMKFPAVASWDDFHLDASAVNPQYFFSQQAAYQQGKLANDIQLEIEKIKSADHLIFQFPLWWFSMPAILKGWFDRVLVKGFAYDAGKVFNQGLLKGKTASLVVSTQSPESAYQPEGVHGSNIDAFLKPIHHTLRFVGIEPTAPFVTYNAFNIDDERRIEITQAYQDYLARLPLLQSK